MKRVKVKLYDSSTRKYRSGTHGAFLFSSHDRKGCRYVVVRHTDYGFRISSCHKSIKAASRRAREMIRKLPWGGHFPARVVKS